MALAMLCALSLHHLPALSEGLYAASAPAGRVRAGGLPQAASPRLQELLSELGFDVHYLQALLDLLSSPEL